jgi:sugar (pentulose or hexulose) kinase
MARTVLAFDLGASSGRAMLARLEDGRLSLTEVHRFDNVPVKLHDTLYWDFPKLMQEIYTGLQKARVAGPYESVAIDTWGVDFGLLDKQGYLMENPVHYRDARTEKAVPWVFGHISSIRLYAITGIQHMPLNTVFQLAALKKDRPAMLENAATLLPMPNLIAYFLTGQKQAEYTMASTMELLPAGETCWSQEILSKLGIPPANFPPIVAPGTPCGVLSDALCKELDIPPVLVLNTACHDTASAVAAVPAQEKDFLFLSSGTWSLMGTERDMPVVTEESRDCNFTNEGGVNGTIRFLKNIMGLWIVQECRRHWASKEPITFGQLAKEAEAAAPFACFIDPDDPLFLPPGDMPQRIRLYLVKTGQTVPETRGGLVRCIYESLAMTYRQTAQTISRLTGKEYKALYAVGGGTQASLLMQMAADAMNMPVMAGPSEATALGNAMVQLIARKVIQDVPHGRSIIAASVSPQAYLPQNTAAWEEAFHRFRTIMGK